MNSPGVSLDAAQRRMRAQVAINTRLSRMTPDDRRQSTSAARRAALQRFERQVDPDGTMDPRERAERAEYARRAYFTAMAMKSAQSRSRKRPGEVSTSERVA